MVEHELMYLIIASPLKTLAMTKVEEIENPSICSRSFVHDHGITFNINAIFFLTFVADISKKIL